MTSEQNKAAARHLRMLADEIERGEWESVDFSIENDLRDEWGTRGELRGRKLVGRRVVAKVAIPTRT